MNASLLQLPLLAVDIETVFFVIIVIFSFIGWIFKLIKQLAEQPPALGGRQANAAPNRDKNLQNEIDQFLIEVVGKDKVQEARIERKRQESQARPRQKPKPQPSAQKPIGAPVAKPEPRRVGGNVATHVQSYMESKIDSSVQSHLQHLQSTIGSNVDQPAASVSFGTANLGNANMPGISVGGLLSNPAAMRQAFLISEIFSPPMSLRNKREN